MDQHQVHFPKFFLKKWVKRRIVLIKVNIELGISTPEIIYGFDRGFAFMSHEIAE